MAKRPRLDLDATLALPWPQFNARLLELNELELAHLLERERATTNRLRILLRVHGRFNRLRAERERQEFQNRRK